ncbi:N-methylhydantoinase A/oxoprolinase/acetone carboxylase beta subunit [Inquilinus ginsengisoli]|uniref:N-methylhydantoinase A/oxoprolinase/acetone carboxylase beta subunit n=1 Tax=Inquilinus ginsengisoli TaxID=363840 RepID=A0ABU1JMQ2_9PROT|nr:hydantoinase/oxoprolinase family protein [Inquilinus ginsengisoli]MDR6289896.1 N-methylhydantoinase A/oxoprolinase/acetone carboxylase beta subunit [Inquilinus ginsengisoli]
MSISLGIDTGGTFTDAVLFDPDRGVLAAAKRLTTKHDLALGIGAAIDAVLEQHPAEIGFVGLSTTLATNAVVEGQGNPACLILIGYPEAALDRAGLREALGADPVVAAAGGHRPSGEEQAPLDLEAVRAAILQHAPAVTAFAVAGYFAVRNPAHEQAVRDLVRDLTGKPVTCGHELTSGLDAPRRALTALLNARLIPLTASLIRAVRGRLDARGITAPLMVVKGDGSLIADRFALARPVETVLSGPAASVVGARWLTGREDCFVSDIGGTTTDIAILKDGRPLLNREGAQVGGWRTMVEAVEIRTFGLGGDSEVRVEPSFGLAVGPRRSVPLSLLVHQHPEMLTALRRQAERGEWTSLDGRFALRLRALDTEADTLSAPERRIWEALADGPQPLESVLTSHLLDRPLERLVARGLVILSGFTPTDAAHVLGLHDGWSRDAALLGAALWAKRPAEPGWAAPRDGEAFARSVLERLTADSALALVETALARDGVADPAREARSLLPRRAVAGPGSGWAAASALLRPALTLGLPLVGIGASAATYYPEIARRLGTESVVPEHAGVTNAIGAVASGVLQAVTVTITAPEEGRFRVHAAGGIRTFDSLEDAAAHAEAEARGHAEALAREAGGLDVAVTVARADRVVAMAGGLDMFVESIITATAAGRPRMG